MKYFTRLDDKKDLMNKGVKGWAEGTFGYSRLSEVELPLGYFANVIDAGLDKCIAVSTDGVGTKMLIAEKLKKFDTIGIDCIAMNVNDLLCVGATPISLLDYIAVEVLDYYQLNQIGIGLRQGAKEAEISIPSGEVAQLPDMMKSLTGCGVDLVGTCIGLVDKGKIIDGSRVEDGDVIIGLKSSGIHSNGLTLARQYLFPEGLAKADEEICMELLTPTKIYVKEVSRLFKHGIDIRGMAHITGDGLMNLNRMNSDVGFLIEQIFPIPLIFKKIRQAGKLTDAQLFNTYNMGVGFCIIVSEKDAPLTMELLGQEEAKIIGSTFASKDKEIVIPHMRLVGERGEFTYKKLK